jgi:hypothetical protein
MDNRIFGIIGLIGGVLAMVGFFGTWYWIDGSSGLPGFTNATSSSGVSYSGWDLVRGIKFAGIVPSQILIPSLALIGSIIIVVGSILVLFKPRAFAKRLLAIGGILALIGVAPGLVHIQTVSIASGIGSYQTGAGYGTYLVAVGGILAILVTLRLNGKKVKR